jgi:hypothetical protein
MSLPRAELANERHHRAGEEQPAEALPDSLSRREIGDIDGQEHFRFEIYD